MQALLASPWNSLWLGVAMAVLLALSYLVLGGAWDVAFWAFVARWVHVIAGAVWVGLIFFVNFIQLPALEALDEQGRGTVLKAVAPSVALWFRHAATLTLIAGLVLAHLNGYLLDALTLGSLSGFAVPKHVMMGIGIWLAIIMWAFTWFVIWPNLKPLVGLEEADADAKQLARRKVRNFARKNLILSIPVLFTMVAAQNLF